MTGYAHLRRFAGPIMQERIHLAYRTGVLSTRALGKHSRFRYRFHRSSSFVPFAGGNTLDTPQLPGYVR